MENGIAGKDEELMRVMIRTQLIDQNPEEFVKSVCDNYRKNVIVAGEKLNQERAFAECKRQAMLYTMDLYEIAGILFYNGIDIGFRATAVLREKLLYRKKNRVNKRTINQPISSRELAKIKNYLKEQKSYLEERILIAQKELEATEKEIEKWKDYKIESKEN